MEDIIGNVKSNKKNDDDQKLKGMYIKTPTEIKKNPADQTTGK